jgi:hypothetical protein
MRQSSGIKLINLPFAEARYPPMVWSAPDSVDPSELLTLRMEFCEAKQEVQYDNRATFRFFEVFRQLKNE